MRNTTSLILLAALLTATPAGLAAQPHMLYGADFSLRFDNREFTPSNFSPSETIFGTKINPYIGIGAKTGQSSHKLALGLTFFREFGDVSTPSERMSDILMYYEYTTSLPHSDFLIIGGVFPRHLGGREWNTAFFSEAYLWKDPNVEGLLMSWTGKKSSIDVACDWIGLFGADRTTREQFLISSTARYTPGRHLSMGYDAYMMHFANSLEVGGVCDNILAEPWVKVSTGGRLLDNASLKLGYIQSLQRNRLEGSSFEAPSCVELETEISKYGFRLLNRLYFGRNLLSLYNRGDAAGNIFGERLYCSDPFFLMRDDGSDEPGSYDRLSLSYSPPFGKVLKLEFSAVFHFNNLGYSGCQQVISLRYSFQGRHRLAF